MWNTPPGPMATDPRSGLPADLPVPVNDGACAHLPGLRLPSVPLLSTAGGTVDLAALPGRTVVYCYPRTGRPGEPLPTGWELIPGARGCTPQACAFRDRHGDFARRDVRVLGVSAQTPDEQAEAARRLGLPFDLLSDARLDFARALRLPTFEVDGRAYLRRLTLIVRDGRVEHVFYPVFPPDRNPDEVLAWLDAQPM